MEPSKPVGDAAARFSDRVADYVRYRPSYPERIVQDLLNEGRLSPGHFVADIGSGTGLLSRLFLSAGCQVIGVEPNRAMRLAGEAELQGSSRFSSIAGTAESTDLPGGSVDWVVAGQAFHWFDRSRAGAEFRRILRPGGMVALIWNDRQHDTTRFLRGYEELLRNWGTDYDAVNHRHLGDQVFEDFFGTGNYERRSYANNQRLDYQGLLGRLLSSSYTPPAGTPERTGMEGDLRRLFRENVRDGHVEILYDTRVWIGILR
jgi:SAM-dependent methyltransferase